MTKPRARSAGPLEYTDHWHRWYCAEPEPDCNIDTPKYPIKASPSRGPDLPPYPGVDARWDARYRAGHLRGWDDAADALFSHGPDLREALEYEEMRKELGWPTPNQMRQTADALDSLTTARYGEVLRWFADLCDAALDKTNPEPELTPHG